METAYGLKTRTTMDVAEAETKVRELLAEEGFGILTEIDVAATLKAKLDLDRGPYKILGACNPALASRALDTEIDVGLLLPCNVVVYAEEDETVVAALDPATMVNLAANPGLEPVAADARSRIERVIAGMSD